MKLDDLFDVTDFLGTLESGYVRVQVHPALPYYIANYTEKAQYESAWTPVTRQCRGLIYDDEHNVIARPYPKFFNYGDELAGQLDLDAPAIVTDKLDGSLGISYPTPDGLAVATRGSFNSEQAKRATQILRDKYPHFRGAMQRMPVTFLWEIVYPENRIVVDYGDMEDLVLHAILDNESGGEFPDWERELLWDGPHVETFEYKSLREALAAPPRDNAEGLVVQIRGDRVKLKQADYVELHKIVTGLSERTVWEWLGSGKSVMELCESLPDEFHKWVNEVAFNLAMDAANLLIDAQREHANIVFRLTHDYGTWERGDFAHAARDKPKEVQPYLFLLLDGNIQKARDLAWKSIKPSGVAKFAKENAA